MYRKIANKIRKYLCQDITATLDEIKLLQAKQMLLHSVGTTLKDIHAAEFKVFSQWGEDGIIQWALSKIPDIIPVFIEFGVEDYQESNTRFLLSNNNWRGLIIDGSEDHMNKVRSSNLYWQRELTAVHAFVDKENINFIFKNNYFTGNIGLLSIDIDGNDYWIWEAIDSVQPQIVICEYNSLFGAEKKVTIPYRADFLRSKAHYSNLYWGASLAALEHLASRKGYALVGSNSVGTNAFFVRKDCLSHFEVKSVLKAYMPARIRESRDHAGQLNYLTGINRLKAIKEMPLLDLEDMTLKPIGDLYDCQ